MKKVTMKIDNLEAIVHCLDQSEILEYLENLTERDRCRLISHGHIAIQIAMEFNKDLNVVRILLERVPECQVNLLLEDGNTLLHVAVSLRSEDFVKWVLDRADMNPNLYNQRGETPLHKASKQGCLKIIELLLSDRRVNVFALTKSKQTIIHVACQPGFVNVDNLIRKAEVVHKLIDLAATTLGSGFFQFLKKQDIHGKTALHYLAENGFEDAICHILNGLRIDEKFELVRLSDKQDQIALHYAVEKGHLRAVERLLPFEDCKFDGMETMYYAVRSGRQDILQACLSTRTNFFVGCGVELEKVVKLYLELLEITSHYEIAIDLLQSLYDMITIRANEFPSLLHWAIKGNVDEGQGASLIKYIFKWQPHLIDLPLDVDTNQTPLHISVLQGNYKAVQALCSYNSPSIRQKDFRNKTPLDYAFKSGNESIRRIVMELEGVKQYLGRLHKNREMYVVASNAILVVSVLVVTVTFAHCPSKKDIAELKANLEGQKLVIRIADTLVATSIAFVLSMIATILAAFAALPFSFGPFFVETVHDDRLRNSLFRTKVLVVLASHFPMLSLSVITFAFVCTTFIAPWVNWECQIICLTAVGFFLCVSTLFLVAHGIRFLKLKKKRALLKQIV